MKKATLLILLLSLSGCSVFDSNVKTMVRWKNGEEVNVSSKSDAIVTIEKGKEKLVVDNRGRPGIIEQFFSAFLLRTNNNQNRTQRVTD